MLRYQYRSIALLIACALILIAPSPVAGKSAAMRASAAADKECRGKDSKKDHPHKESSEECSEDETASSSEEEENESAPGNGNAGGNGNGNGSPGTDPGPPEHAENEQSDPGSPNANPSNPEQPGPPDQGGPEHVQVKLDVDPTIAKVGALLTYQARISNLGGNIPSLTVRARLPEEVDFVGTSQSPVSTGDGTLTWSLQALEPGSVTTIGWTARVVRAGDLDAEAVLTVAGDGIDGTTARVHTYLATVLGVSFQRSGADPDWGTHTERRVVFRSVGSHAPSTAAGSTANPGALPLTGVPVLELCLIAALLVLGGLMLAGPRKRHAAVVMMIVLTAAACTSEAPRPDATEQAQQEEEDEKDRVLGTRMKKDQKAEGSEPGTTPAIPGTDEGTEETDDPDTAVAAPDPTIPDTETETPQVVREVVLVQVPNEAPAPAALGSTSGSNTVSLTWDAESRSMPMATSSRMITAEDDVALLASVSDGDNGISSEVTLTNVTTDERLLVQGHLQIRVSGSGGSTVLSSPPINEVLEPGDEVAASFVLALPSGDYSISPVFTAS